MRLFTQNIDGLDLLAFRSANKDDLEKVLCVHGSLGVASCEFCGTQADFKAFQENVKKNIKDIYANRGDAARERDSHPPLCSECGRPGVKPSTVLYGRPLPSAFAKNLQQDLASADLVVVAGTSCTVSPANMVALGAECRRLVINKESLRDVIGDGRREYSFGSVGGCVDEGENGSMGDIEILGDADATTVALAAELGLLERLWAFESEMATASREILLNALKKF